MDEKYLINLLIAVLVGSITAYLAKRRGRSPVLWFFIGSLFGLLGMLALFLFPTPKQQQGQSGQIEVLVSEPPVTLPHVPADGWFYLDSQHKQFGPTTLAELRSLLEEKKIISSTFVWRDGMAEWKKLEELAEVLRWVTTPI